MGKSCVLCVVYVRWYCARWCINGEKPPHQPLTLEVKLQMRMPAGLKRLNTGVRLRLYWWEWVPLGHGEPRLFRFLSRQFKLSSERKCNKTHTILPTFTTSHFDLQESGLVTGLHVLSGEFLIEKWKKKSQIWSKVKPVNHRHFFVSPLLISGFLCFKSLSKMPVWTNHDRALQSMIIQKASLVLSGFFFHSFRCLWASRAAIETLSPSWKALKEFRREPASVLLWASAPPHFGNHNIWSKPFLQRVCAGEFQQAPSHHWQLFKDKKLSLGFW